MTLTPRLTLLLTVPPLLWAGNAVVGRIAIQSMPPLWLNVLRWAIALALLLPLGWRVFGNPTQRRLVAARWRHLLLLGLAGVGAYNALQYEALRTSTPVNVTLIAASGPVWMMAIGALVFGELPRRAQVLGALLSLLGVAVVLSHGDPAALWRVEFVVGDLLMLLAVASWSIYSWMLARPPASLRGVERPDWNWAEFLVLQIAFGLLWATVFAVGADAVAPAREPIAWSPVLLAALVYVSVFPSLLAYRAWGLGVAQAGPAMAAFFANLTPLFAALLSATMLGEWPRGYHALAFALIVAGIVVSSPRTANPRT